LGFLLGNGGSVSANIAFLPSCASFRSIKKIQAIKLGLAMTKQLLQAILFVIFANPCNFLLLLEFQHQASNVFGGTGSCAGLDEDKNHSITTLLPHEPQNQSPNRCLER